MKKSDLEKINLDTLEAFCFNKTETNKNKPGLNGRNVYEFLKKHYNGGCMFGINHLLESGTYLLYGWEYNFKPYLKKYWYKQYDIINEAYAPNKTLLRKTVYGKIDKIIEVQ